MSNENDSKQPTPHTEPVRSCPRMIPMNPIIFDTGVLRRDDSPLA